MRAYREQASSAKGTAGVLANTTKRVQQQEEGESLRAWGRAEERSLSPDGKHPQMSSQIRKHQNTHQWLHSQIPGSNHRTATSEYLEEESRNLNFKQVFRVPFFNSTAHRSEQLGILPWTLSFRETSSSHVPHGAKCPKGQENMPNRTPCPLDTYALPTQTMFLVPKALHYLSK